MNIKTSSYGEGGNKVSMKTEKYKMKIDHASTYGERISSIYRKLIDDYLKGNITKSEFKTLKNYIQRKYEKTELNPLLPWRQK